jgi:hypothetical protein
MQACHNKDDQADLPLEAEQLIICVKPVELVNENVHFSGDCPLPLALISSTSALTSLSSTVSVLEGYALSSAYSGRKHNVVLENCL